MLVCLPGDSAVPFPAPMRTDDRALAGPPAGINHSHETALNSDGRNSIEPYIAFDIASVSKPQTR